MDERVLTLEGRCCSKNSKKIEKRFTFRKQKNMINCYLFTPAVEGNVRSTRKKKDVEYTITQYIPKRVRNEEMDALDHEEVPEGVQFRRERPIAVVYNTPDYKPHNINSGPRSKFPETVQIIVNKILCAQNRAEDENVVESRDHQAVQNLNVVFKVSLGRKLFFGGELRGGRNTYVVALEDIMQKEAKTRWNNALDGAFVEELRAKVKKMKVKEERVQRSTIHFRQRKGSGSYNVYYSLVFWAEDGMMKFKKCYVKEKLLTVDYVLGSVKKEDVRVHVQMRDEKSMEWLVKKFPQLRPLLQQPQEMEQFGKTVSSYFKRQSPLAISASRHRDVTTFQLPLQQQQKEHEVQHVQEEEGTFEVQFCKVTNRDHVSEEIQFESSEVKRILDCEPGHKELDMKKSIMHLLRRILELNGCKQLLKQLPGY